MKSLNQKIAIFMLAISAIAVIVSSSVADEPGPGLVYPKTKYRRPTPPPPANIEQTSPVLPKESESRARMAVTDERECDWGVRLAAGVPVWFFDDEGDIGGAGAYVDGYNDPLHLNLRVGVEGRHMFLGQEAAASSTEYPGKGVKITYIRIPFSAEYIVATDMRNTQLFVGGGPDIVHTANDIGSTTVGGHLSARLLYTFYENWGVAIEGGYMWGEARKSGKDVSLDGAYVAPTLNYTF